MPDHLLVVFPIPPWLALAAILGQLKVASSQHINEQYMNGTFAWQAE
jgi:REP element-mobilizing transposase RayT